MADLLAQLSLILGIPLWVFLIALVWVLVWKALALWKSARLNQPIWFIVLLVVNTFGILEILYIFLFSTIKLGSKSKKTNNKKRK
jgi:hypothetical protein